MKLDSGSGRRVHDHHVRILLIESGVAGQSAGVKADCVITADPLAFLLEGYGRVSQLSPYSAASSAPAAASPGRR